MPSDEQNRIPVNEELTYNERSHVDSKLRSAKQKTLWPPKYSHLQKVARKSFDRGDREEWRRDDQYRLSKDRADRLKQVAGRAVKAAEQKLSANHVDPKSERGMDAVNAMVRHDRKQRTLQTVQRKAARKQQAPTQGSKPQLTVIKGGKVTGPIAAAGLKHVTNEAYVKDDKGRMIWVDKRRKPQVDPTTLSGALSKVEHNSHGNNVSQPLKPMETPEERAQRLLAIVKRLPRANQSDG